MCINAFDYIKMVPRITKKTDYRASEKSVRTCDYAGEDWGDKVMPLFFAFLFRNNSLNLFRRAQKRSEN